MVWNKGIKTGKNVDCLVCRKNFYLPPSKLNLKKYFCSFECNYNYHHIKIKCVYCGKYKWYTKTNYNQKINNNQKLFFCSHNCSSKYHTGKDASNYGKTSWCKGLTKETNTILLKKSKSMLGKNNPMFNKKLDTSGCNFYIEDLGHRCRSSWEINFGRILKYLNISYKYESKTFNLKQGDSYTPDFYLLNLNLYIEIKGYYTNKFKNKFLRFKLEYPKINILVIDEKIFEYIKSIYINKINWQSEGKIKKYFKFKESKIKKITKTIYKPKQVYNLSVEDDESFIINGIVVHNTRPHPFIETTLKQDFSKILANALQVPGAVEVTT